MGTTSRAHRSQAVLRATGNPDIARGLEIAQGATSIRPPVGPEAQLISVARWVAAPFLLGYVNWIIQRSRELGVDRLYFLSRDGQLLYRVADDLRASGDPPCGYLFASRRSSSLASLRVVTTEDVLWLSGNAYVSGRAGVIERLGLEDEEPSHGTAATSRRPLGVDEAVALAASLAVGRAGRELERRAAHLRPSVLDYLGQEGFLDPGLVGLVDLGGVGSHLRALRMLRAEAGPVAGFLVSRAALPAPLAKHYACSGAGVPGSSVHIETYMEQHDGSVGLSSSASAVLQTFCAADHGTVLRYHRGAERTDPVLDAHRPSADHLRNVRLVQETVLDAVRTVRPVLAGVPVATRRAGGIAAIEAFASHPIREEARVWGGHPMEPVGAHPTGGARPFAAPYSWRDVARSVRSGALPGGWVRWHSGSLQLSSPGVRWTLWTLRGAKRLARRGPIPPRAGGARDARVLSSAPTTGQAIFRESRGARVTVRDAVRLRRHLLRSPAFRSGWIARLRVPGRATTDTRLYVDVFDTVLTRSVVPTSMVEVLLAAQLDTRGGFSHASETIVEARRRAYRHTHRRAGGDPLIEDVYHELQRTLAITPDEAARILEVELDVERWIARPVEVVRSRLDRARNVYGPITFLSDMHLPSPFIRSLLVENGVWRDGDELWVSAEAGADKRTGRLFRMVRAAHGLPAACCLHIGDDRVTDAAAPRWMGWRVAPLRVAVATPAERALGGTAADGAGDGPALAGAARLQRLKGEPSNRDPRCVELLCPVIVGYASWVIEQACEGGVDALQVPAEQLAIFTRVVDALGGDLTVDAAGGVSEGAGALSIDVTCEPHGRDATAVPDLVLGCRRGDGCTCVSYLDGADRVDTVLRLVSGAVTGSDTSVLERALLVYLECLEPLERPPGPARQGILAYLDELRPRERRDRWLRRGHVVDDRQDLVGDTAPVPP